MGVNTKDIRARIRSVNSTMHITKAMELVASSKMRRARERMEESRFYRRVLEEAFADLAASDTIYSRPRKGDLPALHIVAAGDRGLAGGYNSNVFKLAQSAMGKEDLVIPIGRRTAEYFSRRGWAFLDDMSYPSEGLSTADCASFAARIKALYDSGAIGEVHLVCTRFVSMLTQTAQSRRLLPLTPALGGKSTVLYEPDPATVLAAIIPEYVAGTVYSAVCEAFACELAARRSAMDAASKNAEAMIENLHLQYNRARQSTITREITEIVAGSGS